MASRKTPSRTGSTRKGGKTAAPSKNALDAGKAAIEQAKLLQKAIAREAAAKKRAEDAALRAKLSALKKLGLVSKRIDLRTYKPTKYMRGKIRKVEGVLTGKQQVVKLTPEQGRVLREQYKGLKNIQFVNGRVVVNTPKNETADIKDNMLRRVRKLGGKDGAYIESIRIPVDARNPNEILRWIEGGGAERAKFNRDYFGFRYYGNASLRSFPDTRSLLDYLQQYKQFEDGASLRDDFDFELFRVWPPEKWEDMARQEKAERDAAKAEQRRIKKANRVNATGRSGKNAQRTKKRATKRKKKEAAKPIRKEKRVYTPKKVSDYERIIAEATAARDALRERERAKKRKQRAKK